MIPRLRCLVTSMPSQTPAADGSTRVRDNLALTQSHVHRVYLSVADTQRDVRPHMTLSKKANHFRPCEAVRKTLCLCLFSQATDP